MNRPAARREQGFTLVEMLAVLAIIAVMAGATALGIGAATRAPTAEAEARRLAQRIQAAADEAMVSDRRLALAWDARGYAILALDRGRRAAGAAYDPHRLPAGLTLAVAGGASPAVLGIDGAGVPLLARLDGPSDRWAIRYDGVKAQAMRVPGA